MVQQYRFHLIGLVVGLVMLGVLATAEVPEFSLLQHPAGQADDRPVEKE